MIPPGYDFSIKNPEYPLLRSSDNESVFEFLHSRNLLQSGESVLHCGRIDHACHNLTLRVVTTERSLVLKQMRPWDETHPDVAMPWNRDEIERRFYQAAQLFPEIGDWLPRLLLHDAKAHCLVFEDLDDWHDCSDIYRGSPMGLDEVEQLARFLQMLHHTSQSTPPASRYENPDVRRFLRDTYLLGVLDDATWARFEDCLRDRRGHRPARKLFTAARRAVARVAEYYMRAGDSLVHGDFRPSSWLRKDHHVRIVDTEFSFFGMPEIDAGMMVAHLWMASRTRSLIGGVLKLLRRPGLRYDLTVVAEVAGAEILRQLALTGNEMDDPEQTSGRMRLKTAIALLRDGKLERLAVPSHV